MADTAIEWADTVWNPTTGCDRVSPGCDNCYALTMARRLKGMGSAKYQRDGDPRTSGPGFGLTVHPGTLDDPFHWAKPRKVFVNSMSDLFHKGVPDAFIAQVFAVMAETPQHTYQVLTKRPARLRAVLSSETFRLQVVHERVTVASGHYRPEQETWPLPNVWIGTSVEDQKRAELRIPALLATPAAVRFLSCEPLLGAVDITTSAWGIDWVIVGGESGPGARRMELGWAGSLVSQCRAAGTACFVKQLGSAHGPHKGGDIDTWPAELQVREFPQSAQPAA